MTARVSTVPWRTVAPILMLFLMWGSASAQTKIIAPPNKTAPAEDVKLGLKAAEEVRKQLPLLDDVRIGRYLEDLGQRLAAAVPPEFRHQEFRYSFEVVNQKEINAFALPGGPMFVNRGMMEAAKSEGEVAGVMAHELSHVVLRHGTAGAAKSKKFEIGAVLGQVAGAVTGGALGSLIAQGSNLGFGAFVMKYSREYEKQADLMGAQIMSRAGYDARDMASMFKTIEKQGGGGPEWMSDHPNPGNRVAYITKEAQSLHVESAAPSGEAFAQVQTRLREMSPALTATEIAKRQKTGAQPAAGGTHVIQVAAPATQYRTYDAGSTLRLSVPANWKQASSNNTLMFAPDGAFFRSQSGTVFFTHGVEVGIARSQTQNLQRDTDALLRGFARSNPQLRRSTGYESTGIGGRQGLTTTLSNVSDITGQPEYISLSTAQLRDGSVLYVIGVAPQTEASAYADAFSRVRQNIQINDR